MNASTRLTVLALTALALVACDPSEPTVTTVTQVAGALTSTSPEPTESAGVTPMGDASVEDKTQRPSQDAELVVTQVRMAPHDGFDRLVFEFEGQGEPGWFIQGTDSPTQQGSGQNISYQDDWALNVNIDGTLLPFELGLDDPDLSSKPQGEVIREVLPQGTFEGRTQFVVGLNGKHPYSVSVLHNPTRLVIDIR